ncbi:sensor histidine kinase [uncultured Treponema sp.]|uniref:sensor histidine kinase n=1 Tax=uncultured Treponema sp. TaxID=162155 RepID=UPI0025D0120F|nr:sensor histidine kinase [uncultured Treponema sp.]
MKKITVFILSVLFTFSAFAHKAQKQTEPLMMEGLTQKWMECESAEESEFEKHLEDFYAEVQKVSPSDTVIYYFPEAKVIYENIVGGINEGDRQKIAENVCGWEILQKNLAKLQLEQVYYSYRILIFVIIIAVLASLVFSGMYLLSSKLRKENIAFTAQMIKTQEAERERISNELHDTVCQDLGVLQFRLEDEESVSLCRKIASDVRGVCYALTPSDLSEGILEALISLCHVLQKQSGVEIVLSIQDELKNNNAFKTFPKDKNLNIYRITQEIITNAIKHSGAESVSVLVRTVDEKSFKIIVSDDGKGFDLKNALKKKNHFGLKNVQTRAEGFGGGVSFNTEKGAGTQVTVAVPY